MSSLKLRGGVALDRKLEVGSLHAAAVVADPDQAQAATGRGDVDARRAGVDRIFDQLFDDARRTLNDLTRGDAVDEVRRQLTYGHRVPRFRSDICG